MAESNVGQRKMSRRVNATTGGYHGAQPSRGDDFRKLERKFGRNLPSSSGFRGAKTIRRALKKRIKTREERAARKNEF